MSDPIDEIRAYFTERIEQHGASPLGVDWKSSEAQEKRFDQALRVRDSDKSFSLIDWGCGYGALYGYLQRRNIVGDYTGFDITPAALEQARANHAGARFVGTLSDLPQADYVVACGVYNIKYGQSYDAWTSFVHEQLRQMYNHCERGIAATFLTSYSDPPKQRPELYYADPMQLFDFAKRTLSPNVSVLHDYGHWDFTLVVRKVAL